VQPAASALRALSLRAEAAGVACVQAAQPWEAAGSGAQVQPPEVAVAVSDVAAEPQQEAVAAEPDAVLQPGEAAAEAARAVEALRPVVVAEAERDAEVRRPAAAERPALASWVCRPGLPLPWPGPRRAVRTAHAMWRSRTALPSKPLWQAARCEGLS
jgi:hypothetical protein